MFKKIAEYKWFIAGTLAIAVFAAILFLPKISLEKKLLQSGKRHQERHEPREAIEDYKRIVRYAPESSYGLEAARLGGGLCLYEIKEYEDGIFFFRHIVRHGQKQSEIRWAQEKLAEIFYEKLSNYEQAISEYERLLAANPSPEAAADYRLRLGRSYYYLANFDQAIFEASDFVAKNANSPKVFQMLSLKGDSYLAQKKTDEAIATYSEIERRFPESEEIFQVKLNKSVAYEDKKDWDNAIAVLEHMKDRYPHPDVIDLKIKSIIRRKARKKD